MTLLLIEGLDGGFVLDQCNNDLAVVGNGGLAGDDDITVENAGIDHTLAFDMQGEQLVGLIAVGTEGNVALDLLHSEDGLTGGNGAEQRNIEGLVVLIRSKTDGTVQILTAGEQTFFLQLFEVTMDGGGGFDGEIGANLPDRRRYALGDTLVDLVKDLLFHNFLFAHIAIPFRIA